MGGYKSVSGAGRKINFARGAGINTNLDEQGENFTDNDSNETDSAE